MGRSSEASVRGWEEDIETAIEELQDTSGATRIALVGLRLGATLATHVAVRNKKRVEALALWDPVVSGSEYLDELLACTPGRPVANEGDSLAVRGFPLTSVFAEELRTLDLVQLIPSLPTRTRVIASAPLRSHEILRAELQRRGRPDVAVEQINSLLAWVEYRHYGAGAIPATVLDTIVRWVR